MHELMHQYKQLDEGGVKQKTVQQLKEYCFSTHVCNDIGWNESQVDKDFSGFYRILHQHLEDLSTSNQPLGLHTFGELSKTDYIVTTLVQMLGLEFSRLANEFEHQYYRNEKEQHSHGGDAHTYHKAGHVDDHKSDYEFHAGKDIDVSTLTGYHTIKNYVILDGKKQNQQALPFAKLNSDLQAEIKKARQFYQQMTGIRELQSIVDFLQAKYIPVKTGGDPIRHPESLATGYNLYGFDPSKVPTKAAFDQGKELVDDMIANYYLKHGEYPDKMAFSLWSIETMRHYGVLESQALYAMGMRPVWGRGERITGTEVIPYAELKRPRVDVVLSATGLYRDVFPSVMQLLAKAVKQVAQLKEDSNSIWKNSQSVKKQLMAQGVDEEETEYLSTIRLFSNESGDYGTGIDSAAWASDTWQTDKKISDNYLAKMGYFFGADNSRWGEKALLKNGQSLDLYAKQLSGTDIA